MMTTPKIYNERWRLQQDIAEAGQSWTHLVTDERGDDGGQYVLKRLKNIKRIDRFKREIEVVRNLSHPGIVRLIDFDLEPEGKERPILVTEWCKGGSLGDVAEKATSEGHEPFWRAGGHGPLPSSLIQPLIALNLFLQICEAMNYAHGQEVVHRDIKPDNIFLKPVPVGEPEGQKTGGWQAVVGDFGICHVKDGERFTLTEEAVGPRGFMAPEVEEGRQIEVTAACDVYSLGKLLYWMLTGKVVPRESYREKGRDLKGYLLDSVAGWNNIYLEHVNRLLDLMIVHDPQERRSLNNLLILLRRTIRLVEKEYNPIAESVPQFCQYCGEGVYRALPTSPTDLTNFGLRAVASSNWRILACNNCGHIELFRADYARQGASWDEE